MKYKYNDEWVDLSIKALDSMPVGTQVEYTGDTIPTGWEEVNDYSTSEINTGKKWIDGKPIYRKVIECGALPNATSKTISTGLSNIRCVKLSGFAIDSSGYCLNLPHINTATLSNSIQVELQSPSTIYIRSGSNYSTLTGYIVIEYTKS